MRKPSLQNEVIGTYTNDFIHDIMFVSYDIVKFTN